MTLGDHGGKGKWVFIKVRPEDSKDGRLELRFRRLPYGDAWSSTPYVTHLIVAE